MGNTNKIKVLQINGYETPGKRFHGLAIRELLRQEGIESTLFAWEKDTEAIDVLTCKSKTKRAMNYFIKEVEKILSLQSSLFINLKTILELKQFKEADIIHLHIIHSGYFRLNDLIVLAKIKPIVWTFHDPWPLTGHCVYPLNCERWKIGCGSCPDLNIPFSIKKDTTKMLFKHKKEIYKKSNFDIIVASDWMNKRILESPMLLGKTHQIYKIPFGIDLNFFSSAHKRDARKRFDIPENSTVITFRGGPGNPFKGVSYIVEALKNIDSAYNVYVLTINAFSELEGYLNFPHQDLGWVNDDVLLRDFIAASDIFLIPSIAEAFGVMAIEAMACSVPVICFESTSLPEITFSPTVGIAVPFQDSMALRNAIVSLLNSPEERKIRGNAGRQKAEEFYSQELFAKNLANCYRRILTNENSSFN